MKLLTCDFNQTYMSIYLPTGYADGFKITLKRKEADYCLDQILPMINDFLAAYREGNAINIKGVIIERDPIL